MKTKRYFNQLLKPYKNIIKEIAGNYTDIRVVTGKKFCCYCRDNYDLEIEVPLTEDILGHKAFYAKMKNRLKEFNIQGQYSSEILSFLHEVGHIYTYNKWNDWKYMRATYLITLIQMNFSNSKKVLDWAYKKYFNLKLEYNADKWAMTYIKEHQAQVQEWDRQLAENYKKYIPKLLQKMELEIC